MNFYTKILNNLIYFKDHVFNSRLARALGLIYIEQIEIEAILIDLENKNELPEIEKEALKVKLNGFLYLLELQRFELLESKKELSEIVEKLEKIENL